MRTASRSVMFGLGLLGMSAILVSPVLQAQSAARPQVRLPRDEVRTVILKNCVSCHGIDEYAFHALDRDGWQEILNTLHKEERGLTFSRADEAMLLDYLSGNFGPDSVPFPRNYVAREITEFFSNADARVFLGSVCAECHEIRVFDHRKDANGWRALVLDMRERGARINDQNLEKLVEWLTRVRGLNPVE